MLPIPSFLLLGDRNMEGRAPYADLPVELRGPHSNVLTHNATLDLIDDELEVLTNNKSTSLFVGHGPEMSFGPAIRNANSGRRVFLMKLAIEASQMAPLTGTFNDWSEENYTNDMRSATDLKLDLVASTASDGGLAARDLTLDVRGIVLSLGIIDAASVANANEFADRLRFLVGYFREQIRADGRTNLPLYIPIPFAVILPSRTEADDLTPEVDTVRAGILAVAAEDATVFAIEADGLGIQSGVDFDSEAQIEIGVRCATALAPYVANGFHLAPPLPTPTFLSTAEVSEDLETTLSNYGGQAIDLLPQGLIWTRRHDSNLRRVLEALLYENANVDLRARDLEREAIPKTTSELLTDWERILGLPGPPDPLPGFYLDATETEGADDLGASATGTEYPVPIDFPEVEFTVSAILQASFLRVGSLNGWKTTNGDIASNTLFTVFRRLSSTFFKGYRFYLSANTASTVDVGGGSLAPAMRLRIQLGDSTAINTYDLEDGVGVLAGKFPLAEALAGPAGDGINIVEKWASISLQYRGNNGPTGAREGLLRVVVNGKQIAPDIAIPQIDRMQLAATGEGVAVGRDGSFNQFVGRFDQVRVYERLLPLEELVALWNDGAPLQIHGGETGIVFGWEFDLAQGSPLVTLDKIGSYANADLELGADALITSKPDFGIVGPNIICANELSPTEVLRRFEAVAKIGFQGSKAGQSAAFFVELAASVGFEITVSDNKPFVPGSVAGDSITQGNWVFVWEVHAPEINPVFFSAGSGTAGERLVVDDARRLVCALEEHKPAQTTVFFRFDLENTTPGAWTSIGPPPAVATAFAPNVLASQA